MAELTLVGACVADTAVTVWGVEHPGPQLCVFVGPGVFIFIRWQSSHGGMPDLLSVLTAAG